MLRVKSWFLSVAILVVFTSIPAAYSAVTVPNFDGFRVPDGGVAKGAAPGGAGRIVIYSYQLTREQLAQKVRAQLTTDGWKLTADRKSPRGTVRLSVLKQGKTIHVSITRNGPHAALILRR